MVRIELGKNESLLSILNNYLPKKHQVFLKSTCNFFKTISISINNWLFLIKHGFITYKVSGFKAVIWLILQIIRVSIFWTRDMKRKDTGRIASFFGNKIFQIQDSEYLIKRNENIY